MILSGARRERVGSGGGSVEMDVVVSTVEVLQPVVCQLLGGSVEDDAAALKPDDSAEVAARECGLVQRHEECGVVVFADFEDEFEDVLCPGGVERGDGLVGEEDRRLLGERACDGDALLLAAAQGVGALVDLLAQADLADRGPGDAHVFFGEPAQE